MTKEKKIEAVEKKEVEAFEETAETKEDSAEKKSSKKSDKKPAKPKTKKIVYNFDKTKTYPIAEAIKIVKEAGKEKFDASVEVHFRLGIDPAKGEQQVRGTVVLPHGVGKTVRVIAFVEPINEEAAKKAGADLIGNEEMIEKIKKTEKTEFDLAIAEPSMMKKMGMIAKILGTRGLMPSPKNDTVAVDPIKAITEFKKGKLSFKNDDTGNLHALIGKKSFDDAKLVDNFNAFLEVIKKSKPSSARGLYIKNISVASSMGQGVKVEIS
ncbi:MAG: 50S ribosomal protein L1 [Patescibacteria group bacterium]|jgi:large subunit ribosomal protein L1